jgi:hypothetical protein
MKSSYLLLLVSGLQFVAAFAMYSSNYNFGSIIFAGCGIAILPVGLLMYLDGN